MNAFIAVLVHDRLDFTRECMESLLAHTPREGHTIVCVDNGSNAETRAYLSGLDGVSVIRLDRNRGLAGGFNVAIKRCPPNALFVRVNNDVRFVRDDWLESLLRWAEKLPRAGQLSHWYHDNRNKVPYACEARNRYEVAPEAVRVHAIVSPVVALTPLVRREVGLLWSPADVEWWSIAADYSLRVNLAKLESWYVDTGKLSPCPADDTTPRAPKKTDCLRAEKIFYVHLEQTHNLRKRSNVIRRRAHQSREQYINKQKPIRIPIDEPNFAEIVKCGKNMIVEGDATLLYHAARKIKARTLLEIGSMCGCSTAVLGLAAQEEGGHLYCIDPAPRPEWEENVNRYALDSCVTLIRAESPWVEAETVPRQLDFLFLDGDHRPRWVITDYHYWSRFLRVGGIVAFHDWTGAGGVGRWIRRAVGMILEDDWLKEIGRSEPVPGTIAFEKIKDTRKWPVMPIDSARG